MRMLGAGAPLQATNTIRMARIWRSTWAAMGLNTARLVVVANTDLYQGGCWLGKAAAGQLRCPRHRRCHVAAAVLPLRLPLPPLPPGCRSWSAVQACMCTHASASLPASEFTCFFI